MQRKYLAPPLPIFAQNTHNTVYKPMKHFLLLLLLLCSLSTFAQSKRAQKAMLQRDLDIYRRVSLHMDFDSIFQFMPPAMFELVPQDSLKDMMQKTLENDDLTMDFTRFEYKGKPKVKQSGEYFYSVVPYDGGMDIHLKKSADEQFMKIMLTVMKQRFGRENVKSEGDSLLHITMRNKKLVAFKTADAPIWSFVEDKRTEKDASNAFMEAIVPEAVMKALK
jgi:hypothetical protein